jgi:MFS family permease
VILAGFRALAADGDARLVIAILAARMLVIGVTDVLFVLLAIDLFGTGESGAALLTAAMGAGGIIGGAAAFLLVGRRRIAPILATCAVAWGAAFAAMGVTASGNVAPLLLVAGGVGLTVMDVSGRTILQRGVRDEVLARVFGILEGLAMGALAVGSILVPVVVAGIGLRAAVLVFAALLPVLLLLSWPGLRALDRRAVVPARALAVLRRLRLFEALDPPVMEALARAATWETVAAGVRVIAEDEAGDRYYVLESGAMRVTRREGHLRDLDTPGQGFGEVALLRDVPRTATVSALRESVLLVLGREAFLAAVTGHPVVAVEAGRVVEAHLGDRDAGLGARADTAGPAAGS